MDCSEEWAATIFISSSATGTNMTGRLDFGRPCIALARRQTDLEVGVMPRESDGRPAKRDGKVGRQCTEHGIFSPILLAPSPVGIEKGYSL